MAWYYLIRDSRIVNEVNAPSAAEAKAAFDNHQPNVRHGDRIMVCCSIAMPAKNHTWVDAK